MRQFVSIWFPWLTTDWHCKRNPAFKTIPFVTAAKERGRMLVVAANALAEKEGVYKGMSIADARAVCKSLEVIEEEPGVHQQILTSMAKWSIRFTPVAAVDGDDGLLLEATGCCHLWGGPPAYIKEIKKRFTDLGYHTRLTMAPTIGCTWALSRYAADEMIVSPGNILPALKMLPPAALRIEPQVVRKLQVAGLITIRHFIQMPATALRRRCGNLLLTRIGQALGTEPEWIDAIEPTQEYSERLPCMEPVFTAVAIEIAIQQLLESLCTRLKKQQKGIRYAVLRCYRVDQKMIEIAIGTGSPSVNTKHLFKLFEIRIDTIAPGFGIELFTLTAIKVQDTKTVQDQLWMQPKGITDSGLSELIDRIRMKIPGIIIQRYHPKEHYWPERSFAATTDIHAAAETTWSYTRPRPLQLLNPPQSITVTAPVPDYPPMSFRYKGQFHKIVKADGPERIEPEWWISAGQHRDYYYVEDEEGKRYWLFRSGHYDAEKTYQWFLHGFFA